MQLALRISMYRFPLLTFQTRATAIGAIRFKEYCEIMLFRKPASDWTYNISYCLNHAENNVTIILACMPPLRTYFLRWKAQRDEEKQPGDQERSGTYGSEGGPFVFESVSEQSSESPLEYQQGQNSWFSTPPQK